MSAYAPVYDPEEKEKSIQARAGGSENIKNPGELGSVKSKEKAGSLFNPDGDKAGKATSDTAKVAIGAVAGPGGIATAGKTLLKNSLSWVNDNKKKSAAGVGISGIIVAVLLSIFMAIIPLKIEHIVKNLEKRFFSTSEDAMGKMGDKMLKNYVVDKVLPGYNKCGSTISRKCSASVDSGKKNPVSQLYTVWRDNRLENKLAEKGLEFEKKGNTWRVKSVKWDKKGVDIGSKGEKLDRELKNRKEIRAAVKASLENETRWKQVMYRYRVGRLLEEKYGIKRCIVFCGAKDAFADYKSERKLAAKLYVIERVITPRNANIGIAMACLLSGTCDKKLESQVSDMNSDPATEGAPKSEIEAESRKALQSGVSEFGDLKKQIDTKNEIEKEGMQNWVLKKVLGKIIGQTAATLLVDNIPVIGWIDMYATFVHTVRHGSETVRKLIFLTNAPAAVSLFMQYRTYADEIHTGHKDAAEVGSFASSLGPNNKNTNLDKKTQKLTIDQVKDEEKVKGGVAGAEQSPLYGAIMESKDTVGAKTSYLNPLNPAVYAASNRSSKTNDPKYLCNDGKPVPKGQLICPEEKLGHGTGPLDFLSSVLNSKWAQPLMGIGLSEVWYNSAGAVLRGAGSLLGEGVGLIMKGFDKTCGTPLELIPINGAYCKLKDPISKASKELGKAMVNQLIPNPFGENMSGGRTFNMMAAGANVAGNDACTQMGCGKVSKQFVADVINQRKNDEIDSFKKQPFYARMFNTESEYSLVTRVAMAIPIGYQSSTRNSFANLMSNPFGAILNVFGNIFGARYAYAAASKDTVDVFNIGTVGFPEKEMTDDPEAYWDKHDCANQIQVWQNNAIGKENENPETGMPEHQSPSNCLLIKNAVSNLGGALDSSLLSDDDKKHLGNSNSQTSVEGALPSGDAKKLASDISEYIKSGKISCNNQASNCPDIQKTAAGQSIKGGACNVDALSPKLLAMVLKLAQMNHTFVISAICSDHPSNPQSYHHKGRAIDFNYIDGTFIGPGANDGWYGDKLSKAKRLNNDIATFMPKSTGFGQQQCHPDFIFLKGFNVFNDLCHHQHIQVED